MSKQLSRVRCLTPELRSQFQSIGIDSSAQLLELRVDDIECYTETLDQTAEKFGQIQVQVANEVAPMVKSVC